MQIFQRIPKPSGWTKPIVSCLKWKKAFFHSFVFILKQNRKKNPKNLTTALAVLWVLGAFEQQQWCQRAHSTLINPHWCNVNKTMFFQSKLNELAQKVSLVSKFCLTVQKQYFDVSNFVVFKCQFPCQIF